MNMDRPALGGYGARWDLNRSKVASTANDEVDTTHALVPSIIGMAAHITGSGQGRIILASCGSICSVLRVEKDDSAYGKPEGLRRRDRDVSRCSHLCAARAKADRLGDIWWCSIRWRVLSPQGKKAQ